MDQSSSEEGRGQGGPSRNRNRSGGRDGNRSGDRSRSGGGRRRPEPKPTGFQKFIKAITFGLVDPTKSKKKGGSRSGKKPQGTAKRRPPLAVEPTTPRLYVGNLDYSVTDEDLTSCFSGAGTVVSASVVSHGDSGRSKGFAFVEMGSLEEAKAAIAKLNDTDFKGRQMLVTGAKSDKPERRSNDRSSSRGGRDDRRGGERSERGGGDRRERTGERRDGDRPGRSGGREGDRRGGRGSDRRGGGRGPEGRDRIEKPTHQAKPREIETVTSATLLVSSVNTEATDEDLHDLFDGLGTVVNRFATGSGKGGSTTDYVVEFSDVSEAQSAVELLDHKAFMGNQLKVTAAPEGATPMEAAPADAAPADTAPVADAPAAEETEAPASEAPVDDAPVEEAPAAEESPVEEVPAEEIPAADATLVEEPPVEVEADEEWSPSEEEKS